MAHVHGSAGLSHGAHHATSMAAPLHHHLAKGAVLSTGLAKVTATSGSSFVSNFFRHPLIMFGLGIAAGYYIHKHRKEIIEAATLATEKGKDFVLQQKETLEDLVAEAQVPEE
jgi:hypothetical protein